MRTPEGKKFGQRLWVTIVVPSAGGSSSDEDKEADKYEALVDAVLAMGFNAKRHRVSSDVMLSVCLKADFFF